MKESYSNLKIESFTFTLSLAKVLMKFHTAYRNYRDFVGYARQGLSNF